MITFGTNPGMVMPIDGEVPEAPAQALKYMGLSSGEPMLGKPVDVVFVGSCTNSRLSDLRDAAAVFRGRKVKDGVRTLIVPGSQDVKRQAEAEGLHEVFLGAGAEWRESGCSMCIAMNGDSVGAGQYSVSTSNRNFEGRQGNGARTLLASPMTAAAAAVTGQVSDPRQFLA
jgi:3-isopropylmalate/(R)-2-methylmalate dehydratase large subunit